MKLLDLREKRVSMPALDAPIKKVEDRDYLTDILRERGWRYLGNGAFGSVFAKPDSNEAFKFFQDSAYLKFLSFTKRMDNPHFPNTGKPFRLNLTRERIDPWYGVMIEKLTEDNMAITPYVRYFDYQLFLPQNRNPLPLEAKKIDAKFPRFRQACEAIIKLVRNNAHAGMGTDVEYDKNMMMRGDCPVFTDPVWQPIRYKQLDNRPRAAQGRSFTIPF